ncbi:MAG: putative glycoside hydrolase, partial [Opitutaceae bacterium]
MQQGLADIVQETRDKLGEDHLMVVNGIRSTPTWSSGFDFPEHVDAAMIEHFGFFNSSTKESMLQDIREMEQAGK